MLKNLLQKITGGDKTYSYEEAKIALEKQNRRDKTILASHADTKAEILYYLATDESPEVRREIAINQNTPHQANDLLVEDEDTEVRQELARKIARMLPDLTDDEVSKVRESALEILENLASDQLPQVRKIVSEELKTFDCVPKQIIRKLADDDHLEVCAPVLEYSPLLSTEDLKEIIAATTVKGAIKAIAQRDQVNEEVSEAVTASLDIPAVAALLANKNAQIRENTLDKIISQANEMEELHRPLAERPNLSLRAIKRIAGFVASSLVDRMINAHNLDESIATELLKQVRERIQETTGDEDDAESLASQAAQFHAKGLLDDAFIENTVKNRQRELLFHCLAQMSEMPLTSIRKILTSKKARRVVALAWRAELNMRTAIKLQLEIACIPSSQVINAKEGVQYPLSRAEMEYDLALYDGGT